MTKWILGLLLLVNIGFFALMQWGGMLTTDADAVALQAPFNADKIRLVSDVTPTSVQDAPTSAVTAVNITPSAPASLLSSELTAIPTAAKQCLEWGEFSGRALADVQTGMAPLRLGDKLSQRIVEHTGGFWVYIPPLTTTAEVQRKIGQLKKLGVDDHFVVQEEGVWFNTISLGVFKTEEAARKFHESLREKGVRSAKVGERMSKLKFTVFVLKDVDATTAEKIKALQRGFPESELKTTDCN